MASLKVLLFLSTTPKNSCTRRASSGWGYNSSWNAMATLSKVTSSWVGPIPPEVMRCVYCVERRATSRAMTSCVSGMTVIRCTDTPSFLSARVRKALLVSTVCPWQRKDSRVKDDSEVSLEIPWIKEAKIMMGPYRAPRAYRDSNIHTVATLNRKFPITTQL